MSHFDIKDKDIEGFVRREQILKYKARFRELYELSRIQNQDLNHDETVALVREVMADSSRIKFDWIM